MFETKTLRPVAGAHVRDPDSRQPLAAAGEEKQMNDFWCRRVRDGSVAVVTEPRVKAGKGSEKQ